MEKGMPLISVITVNYNGYTDTCELIESIKKNISFSLEIIVVDNASKRNEASLIAEQYPWVKCLRSELNLGFAGGNNLGIKRATGKYIFLLNNDTYVTDNFLIHLIEFLDTNPSVGAVSPKIKFAQFPDEIQFAGYTELSPITLRNRTIGFGEKDNGQHEQPMQTYFLHGAALMVKREAIEKAGLMPDIYFLYYEEMDWCYRIRQAGYQLWYNPAATIYHKESKSVGQKSPLKNYYMTRNRLLYAWRNSRPILRYASIAYQLSLALPKNIILSLVQKRYDLAQTAVKGAKDFFNIQDKKRIVRYPQPLN